METRTVNQGNHGVQGWKNEKESKLDNSEISNQLYVNMQGNCILWNMKMQFKNLMKL